MNRVLIVGRPNVGKSSLFNRLIRKKKSIVINKPGITRDILKQTTSWWGCDFEIWDSGGLWSESVNWGTLIDTKVKQAMNQSDLILFIMDAKTGFLPEDKKTFQLIKQSGKAFFTIINKVDDFTKTDITLSDFYCLGISLCACSFEQDKGISDIIDWIVSKSKNKSSKVIHDSSTRLLLAGKTNVGKSTLCNILLKKDRVLTSDIPGTTVDIVSDQFKYQNRYYTLYDSAGKIKRWNQKVESLAEFKFYQILKEIDIVLILVDYTTGPSRQDAQLMGACIREYKPVIIVVNKWDLAIKEGQPVPKPEYRKNFQDKFRFYPHLPILFISALEAKGLGELMKKIDEIYKKMYFRISTSELNRFFMDVIRKAPSPVYGVQDVKFYYLTQTNQVPPCFIAFANYPEGVKNSYYRFLVRQIQKKWHLEGIPIRISFIAR